MKLTKYYEANEMIPKMVKATVKTVLPYALSFTAGAIIGSGVLAPDKEYNPPKNDYLIRQSLQSDNQQKSSLEELLK